MYMAKITDDDLDLIGDITGDPKATDKHVQKKIVWFNAIGFLILHLGALYGTYLMLYANFSTVVFAFLLGWLSAEGVTIGAHRMYTHKSFKGTLLTRLVLITLFTIAGQNCMWVWVRDHRQHHKYSDTTGDPHDASQGFFFSHIGWLMYKKHPDVLTKGKAIDMSDIEKDPIVMFQKKYYKTLYVILAILLPTAIPVYFLNETWWNAFFVCYMARTFIVLNGTWCVNSVAHLYGTKPYNKDIYPMESNFVSLISTGEGWHNYHHTFPWDYKAGEFGKHFNFTSTIIYYLGKWGYAYDLKEATPEMVESRIRRTGDKTHPKYEAIVESADSVETSTMDKDASTARRRTEVSYG